MRTPRLFILSILCLLSFFCQAQIENNADHAFQLATESRKPVLLVFAGSDWCAPCVRFEKQILSEAGFQEYAKNNLVILKADFPQRKKLSDEEQKQNDLLAEQFNPKGEFPKLVLLRENKSVVTMLTYSNQSSAEFISLIKDVLVK
jgi:thioredoxin-related protein